VSIDLEKLVETKGGLLDVDYSPKREGGKDEREEGAIFTSIRRGKRGKNYVIKIGSGKHV